MKLRAYLDKKGRLLVEFAGATEIVRKTRKAAEKYQYVTMHLFADGDYRFTAHNTVRSAKGRVTFWAPCVQDVRAEGVADGRYFSSLEKPVRDDFMYEYSLRKLSRWSPAKVWHKRLKEQVYYVSVKR